MTNIYTKATDFAVGGAPRQQSLTLSNFPMNRDTHDGPVNTSCSPHAKSPLDYNERIKLVSHIFVPMNGSEVNFESGRRVFVCRHAVFKLRDGPLAGATSFSI